MRIRALRCFVGLKIFVVDIPYYYKPSVASLMKKYKFSNDVNKEFSRELILSVNDYFKTEGVSRNADGLMISKSIIILSLYLFTFAIILFGGISSLPILFGCWFLLGVFKAFVGTAVMHDALHGSYSKNKSVNFFVGLSAVVIGVYSEMWKLQHNVLHHTYTNIEHADEDIESRYVLRFTPHQPRRWFHKYQHIYAGFFYCLTSIIWVTVKDFIKLAIYKNKGLIKSQKEVFVHLMLILGVKAIYWTMFLVIPLQVLNYPAWIIVLMFLTMHCATGFLLTIIFQTAHVMPTSDFIEQDDPRIHENWHVHQLLTTTNYAMKNNLISFFFGGLNFQVEHHLFPNICHVHYPRISEIVRETASRHNLPYYSCETFTGALRNHFQLLKTLGRQDNPVKVAV